MERRDDDALAALHQEVMQRVELLEQFCQLLRMRALLVQQRRAVVRLLPPSVAVPYRLSVPFAAAFRRGQTLRFTRHRLLYFIGGICKTPRIKIGLPHQEEQMSSTRFCERSAINSF